MTIPSLDHIRRAYAETSKVTQLTPLLESRALAALTGAKRVFVKPESLQWAGSFKVRGAYWRLMQLSPEERKRGVVGHSSGNFAQGVAAAGQALGVPVTIVMPIDAPKAKSDATRGYGATVVQTDHGERAREEVSSEKAREIAREENRVLVHPFDDLELIAGHAGAGLEIVEQLGAREANADLLLCPVGGGGLIAGIASAFHHLSPQTKFHAVEPEGFNGLGTALERGTIEAMPLGPKSICDGLLSRRPGEKPVAIARAAGITGLTVTDKPVRAAMKTAFERLKLVLEPSGAAALAALLSGAVDVADKTVVVVATGGNVAPEDYTRHLADA
jgi:threonine dehydratase